MANWDWEVEEDFVSNMLQSLDGRMRGIAASENRTGVVYDERMLRHYCTWNDEYTEKPDRLQACLDRCQQLFPRCHPVQSRFATEAEMTLLHDPELVEKLRSISASSEEEMKDLAKKYDYIYFHPAVFENASLALGSSIQLVEEILSNKLNNGMALVRPPGHHAMKSRFCGYCYLNNVSTAAQYALKNHGLERILIVDWDVHHGQGTQFMFYDDPRVLYFSIHRHEHGQEWPNLDEAEYTFVGEGQGLGYNINVPLNVKGCDDSDYMAIILQILLPVAFEFSPQLVLVSAGYDAAMGCPEGEMQVSPAFFAHVVNLLSSLAEGKICLILEGGYCLQSLAESAALSLHALLGDPCPPIGSITAPCDSIRESILNCLKVLRLYWPSLCYQGEGIDSLSYASLLHWPQGGSQTRGTMEEFELDEPCYNINDDDLILSYVKKVELLIANAQYRATSKRVCLAYNSAMLDHKHLRDQGFPERAQRLSRIEQRLRDWGLLERCSLLKGDLDTCSTTPDTKGESNGPTDGVAVFFEDADQVLEEPTVDSEQPEVGAGDGNDLVGSVSLRLSDDPDIPYCENMERDHGMKGRQATDEELRLVHRDSHINRMKNLAEMEEEALLKYHLTFNSVCVCKETHRVACLAVGSVLDVVDEVMADKAASGVAVIRPPGHHAEEGQPMGFCIYNNVAIAAKYALKNHNVERILILDWDVHHGNGIQRVFYEDDRVLYISIHRFDDGMFFPCGSDGHKSRVGKGKGQGYNVNISWARGRMMGDTEYIAAFQQIILPLAYEFCPDLVLISAGFDAAREDYLGGYKLSPQCFSVMTKLLMGLANSRIILVLEGGYNLEMTAASVAVCTSVLLGDPCPVLSTPPTRPLQIAVDTIKSVTSIQSEHWKSLCFQVDLPDADFVKRISGGKLEASSSSSSVQRCKEQTESAEVFETSTPGSSNPVEKEANSPSEDVRKNLAGLKLES